MQLYEDADAEHDDVDAMVNLGNLLENGAGRVERNAARAMELYERTLDKSDDIDRMVSLGVLVKKGVEGVEKNVVQAVELYERSRCTMIAALCSTWRAY